MKHLCWLSIGTHTHTPSDKESSWVELVQTLSAERELMSHVHFNFNYVQNASLHQSPFATAGKKLRPKSRSKLTLSGILVMMDQSASDCRTGQEASKLETAHTSRNVKTLDCWTGSEVFTFNSTVTYTSSSNRTALGKRVGATLVCYVTTWFYHSAKCH